MKKSIPFILIVILMTVILGYFNIKSNKKEANLNIDDEIEIKVVQDDYLKSYYEKMIKGGEYPHFIEFDRNISYTDTINSLLLYKKFKINFDSAIAFENAQKLFKNEWDFLSSYNELYSEEESVDQKVHISYELILLANELEQEIKSEVKDDIFKFYIKYVMNELDKEFINQNVEMMIKNRLAYIGNFLEKQYKRNNILTKVNEKLKNVISEDYYKFRSDLQTVEDYMNTMYAISGLKELQYDKGNLNINAIKTRIIDFIKSKTFDSLSHFEQAIFLNTFVSIYPNIPLEANNKIDYIFQTFMNDNTTLSNSLRFIFLNLFYRSGIGYEESKYYLEHLEHDGNYGFFLPKHLILTMENLYNFSQLQKRLGINFDMVSLYFDELERVLTSEQEIVSFSEMYYLKLLLNDRDNRYPILEKIESKSVGKAKVYIKSNKVNDENFMHTYYAFKIVLDSGDKEFVKENLSRLERFVENAKTKYPKDPNVYYLEALYQDIISDIPNINFTEEDLNNKIANLPDSLFYLNTVYKYLEILNSKDFTLSEDVKNELKNRIESYKTKNGFSPEKEKGYSTILATYYGLTITSLLEFD